MKLLSPTPQHNTLMEDLKSAIIKNKELPLDEILAITSQLVGSLIALQDQTKYTAVVAVQLVEENISIGNKMAIESMFDDIKGNT